MTQAKRKPAKRAPKATTQQASPTTLSATPATQQAEPATLSTGAQLGIAIQWSKRRARGFRQWR
jgi:hypothetical protein